MAREQLPGTSGVRGGVAQVPVVGQPGSQDGGPSALEQSLAALPQALQQVGELDVRTELLQAQRQKTFDTLNAKTAAAATRIPMQTLDAQLRENYQTYPEELIKQGQALIKDQGQQLTPQARAIFTEDATQYLAILHGRATEERVKRMHEASAYVTSQTLYQAQDDYANATNDYERTVALGTVDTSLQQLVEVGAISGTVGATLRHKTIENAVKERALVLNKRDPIGAYLDYEALSKGEPVQNAAANVPRALLSELMTDAQHQMSVQTTQKEQELRHKQAELQQQQNAKAIELRNTVFNLVPTPNNLAAIQVAKQHILEAGRTGALSESLHATLTNLVASWEEKARTYTPVDDEPTKKKILDFLAFSTTPQEFDQAELELFRVKSQLTGTTVQKLGQDIEARRGSMHPLNQEEAKAGRRIIMDTAMPGLVTFGAMGTNFMTVEEKTRLANALNTYEQRILAMDAPTVRREGIQAAREVLQQFYEVPLGVNFDDMKNAQFLPLPLRRGGEDGKIVPTPELAVSVLKNLQVPPEVAGNYLRQYNAWRASAEGQAYLKQYYPWTQYQTSEAQPVEPEARPTPNLWGTTPPGAAGTGAPATSPTPLWPTPTRVYKSVR